jgi:hypothetical protein
VFGNEECDVPPVGCLSKIVLSQPLMNQKEKFLADFVFGIHFAENKRGKKKKNLHKTSFKERKRD